MTRILLSILGCLPVSSAVAAQAPAPQAPAAPRVATLKGMVTDSSGTAIADAEIVVRGTSVRGRTDGKGAFTITGAPEGVHEVWFRRLGFASTQYLWDARADGPTEIRVVLHILPRALNPVVVRAQEDKQLASSAMLRGAVVDTAGNPIEDAEVSIVGANMTAMSRANGGVVISRIPVGAYVVRARKFGYAPNTIHVDLMADEDREIVMRLRPLAAGLDPVVVSERSGYGGNQQAAFDELELRRRWRVPREFVLGTVDLKRYGTWTLDMATKFILNGAGELGKVPTITSILATTAPGYTSPIQDDACILINGIRPVAQPLRVYSANDLELIEIYPSDTELSGTVAARFQAIPGCRAMTTLQHPTYYVLWLKPGA